ncbi:MAG: thiamine phosphate synthase [Ruminococcus sp.]|nr:thiamine phosphate synthase [Ruminococcus sp.]
MKNLDTRIYFITDSTPYTEQEFLDRVRSALRGGVSLIQLREKERSTREYIDLAHKVGALAQEFGVPLIIDDRIDVALASGVQGVHLGQSDMPIKTARKILGDDFIIGATAKTVEQAVEAFEQGADYLGVGAIYPTTTKVKTVLTSTEMLDKICKAVPIPVNAIGGLNKDNIDVLKGIGISGICAVSAIMKADDPENAVKELSAAVKEKLGI